MWKAHRVSPFPCRRQLHRLTESLAPAVDASPSSSQAAFSIIPLSPAMEPRGASERQDFSALRDFCFDNPASEDAATAQTASGQVLKSAFDWSDDEPDQQVRYRTFQSVSRVFRRTQAAAGLDGGDSGGGENGSKPLHGGHGVVQVDRSLGRGQVRTSKGPPIPTATVDDWISKAQSFAENRKQQSLAVQADLYGERGLTGRKSTRSLTGHRSSLLKIFDSPVWNSESGNYPPLCANARCWTDPLCRCYATWSKPVHSGPAENEDSSW